MAIVFHALGHQHGAVEDVQHEVDHEESNQFLEDQLVDAALPLEQDVGEDPEPGGVRHVGRVRHRHRVRSISRVFSLRISWKILIINSVRRWNNFSLKGIFLAKKCGN